MSPQPTRGINGLFGDYALADRQAVLAFLGLHHIDKSRVARRFTNPGGSRSIVAVK